VKTYKIGLQGTSPYSQSRHYVVDKLEKEGADAYERRTWRQRMHVNEDGRVYIPATAFKNCLAEAAKFLSIQIPGKGKATYTKHFEAGLMVIDPVVLPIVAEDVKGEELFVPPSGRRGDGKRVTKIFPFIPLGWTGEVVVYVVDETITGPILRQHMEEAGNLIGVGRFRPRNNGFYGRFKVESFQEVA
jgi:hypothetical protein